jgi:hypothetical protein
MAGPKAKTPAPIDRPLSRAYLREFTGWSTAYPPGISDPTSLRIMENVQVNRDGSVRIRPGLRYISFAEAGGVLSGIGLPMVGSHEPFFLNDGSKAYLFAVREEDSTVGFRVLAETSVGLVVKGLQDDGIDFDVPDGQSNIAFSSDTTYVKYLQIDNKIYALSNVGETMRQFNVGRSKRAKRLSSIESPGWNIIDKLIVVHPEAAWVNGRAPTTERTNLITSPNMTDISGWSEAGNTKMLRSTAFTHQGVYSLRVTSAPSRTNLMPHPLNNPASTGVGGWVKSLQAQDLDVISNGVRVQVGANHKADSFRALSAKIEVTSEKRYKVALDLEAITPDVDTLMVQYFFYTTGGKQIGEPVNRFLSKTISRKNPDGAKAPKGTDTMRIGVTGKALNNTTASFRFKNVVVCPDAEAGTMFHGDSGSNYFWLGDPNSSASVYHPPADAHVYARVTPVKAGSSHTGSIYSRAHSTSRNVHVDIEWRRSDDTAISTDSGGLVTNDNASWTRIDNTGTAPAKTTKGLMRVKVENVPRGEYHYLDSALFEKGSLKPYFDGDSTASDTFRYTWSKEHHASTSLEQEFAVPSSLPTSETKTPNTLIRDNSGTNGFSFAFFYTFNNEVGESAASKITIVKVQRAWQSWSWQSPNVSGEPSGNDINDPELVADQLVAFMPQAVFEDAIDSGATHWNLYGFTWSDQDPVPVTAMRVDRRELDSNSTHAKHGWLQVTPDMAATAKESVPVPTAFNRHNYSEPSRGAQGLVASDRMILVNDPTDAAVIKWTSNQQGNYTDFSASRGGGYKTLTSGNLFIPACVKLWQNPQSVDTLTILCMGVDGYSTGYYMSPAQVASQTEATNIMGFEETTATPGTTSPYGVEVMNNALYHPLDEQLMKSTATNYNINHKSMTDQLADVWRGLLNKQLIVSSQHDNRLYYLVHNPDGLALEPGCRGNEVWVFDAAAENGNWSRWLTQGISLRKIEQASKVAMSLVRPDGLFYFDEDYDRDDVVDPVTKAISQQYISWQLETNTQGANRAHDAWAHLQQANISVGFFGGEFEYGVRGYDVNGRRVTMKKSIRDKNEPGTLAWDLDDYLKIARDMKEWFFFAHSVVDEAGVTQWSTGQISLIQYRYTPVSVNVGYEYGSVETFEYGRAGQPIDARTTDNGVPIPYVDTGRP